MTNTTPTVTVHACPPDGSGLTPCCHRTPLELPRGDRMTEDPDTVTCTTTPAVSTSTRVAYFIQCQQPDGTWETASSGMDALTQDYAVKRLERRRQMMPDFPFRLVRRTTTTTTEEEPVDA